MKTFQCFICNEKDLDFDNNQCYSHESLHVAMCAKCQVSHFNKNNKWHAGDEWKETDERNKCIYCEICGEGGTLMCCDNKTCSHSYCLNCLENWLGHKKLEDFLADDKIHFCCFVCTYKQGASGLAKIYPLYQKFVKDSERFFDIEKSIDRLKKMMKKGGKIDNKIKNLSLSPKNGHNGTVNSSKPFTCFSCFSTGKFTKDKMPKLHKKFKVAMCEKCHKYLDSDDWTFTDGKSDFCVITGDGGEIISCDTTSCQNSFDVGILRKWMDKKELKQILDDEDVEFKCFKCNPKLGKYQSFLKQTNEYQTAFKNEIKEIKKPGEKRSRTDYEESSSPSLNKQVSDPEVKKFLTKHLNSVPEKYKDSYLFKKLMKSCDKA